MPDRPPSCPGTLTPDDVADAPVCDGLLLPLPRSMLQVPDDGALPDIPVPVVPPPSKVEPDIPDAALPIAEQLVPSDVPNGSGLMPPGWNSVAPRGIPIGPTGELDPITPRGEVWPIPRAEPDAAPVPPICAKAELLQTRAASVATINACLIGGSVSSVIPLTVLSAISPTCDFGPLRRLSGACCEAGQAVLHRDGTVVAMLEMHSPHAPMQKINFDAGRRLVGADDEFPGRIANWGAGSTAVLPRSGG